MKMLRGPEVYFPRTTITLLLLQQTEPQEEEEEEELMFKITSQCPATTTIQPTFI